MPSTSPWSSTRATTRRTTSRRSPTARTTGSLVPHPDLLETPADRLRPLDDLDGVSAWRTTRTLFGVERTVLVTYNEKLFTAQSRTLLREIAKRRQRLRELQNRLRLWRTGRIRNGKPPTVEGTNKKVAGRPVT